MSDAKAISITTANGRVLRFGADVPDPDGIPFGLTWSSTMPGGHATCSFNLRVRIDHDVEFSVLDDVRVYAVKGNVTLWEGFVARLPRQSGEDFLLNVQCVGHSAQLKWETGFMECYVDQELARWQEPPLARRVRKISTLGDQLNVDYVPRNEQGALSFDGVGGKSIAVDSAGELMYQMPAGLKIARLTYRGTQLNTANVASPTLGTSDNDDLSSATGTALTLDDVLRSTVGLTPARYGLLSSSASATHTPAAGSEHHRTFKESTVYGDHGVPTRSISGGPDGLYGHDLIANIVSRAAPGLNFTTGPDGSIQDNTSFVVPQCAFFNPVTGEFAILDVNKYFMYEWGVWDKREFFWLPTDPGRLTWEARLDEGVHLGLEGDEADNALNGLMVTYRLPDGTDRVAGPTGTGFDVESDALGDTSVDNTVNRNGIERKWGRLDASFTTSDDGAVQMGTVYLAQLALPARKGQITLTGTVQHPTMGPRPVSEIRAGEWIRLSDHPTDVARRIIQATHNDERRECTIDVGNEIDKVDAMFQRVGIKTSLLGVS